MHFLFTVIVWFISPLIFVECDKQRAGSRYGWPSQEHIKLEVSDIEYTYEIDYIASRKGREGLSDDMRD